MSFWNYKFEFLKPRNWVSETTNSSFWNYEFEFLIILEVSESTIFEIKRCQAMLLFLAPPGRPALVPTGRKGVWTRPGTTENTPKSWKYMCWDLKINFKHLMSFPSFLCNLVTFCKKCLFYIFGSSGPGHPPGHLPEHVHHPARGNPRVPERPGNAHWMFLNT